MGGWFPVGSASETYTTWALLGKFAVGVGCGVGKWHPETLAGREHSLASDPCGSPTAQKQAEGDGATSGAYIIRSSRRKRHRSQVQ